MSAIHVNTDPVIPHPPANGRGSDFVVTSSGSWTSVPSSPAFVCASHPSAHSPSHFIASGLWLYQATTSVGCHIKQCDPCSRSGLTDAGECDSAIPTELLRKCRC